MLWYIRITPLQLTNWNIASLWHSSISLWYCSTIGIPAQACDVIVLQGILAHDCDTVIVEGIPAQAYDTVVL